MSKIKNEFILKIATWAFCLFITLTLVACQPASTEVKTVSVPSAPIVQTQVEQQAYEGIYYFDNYSVFELQSNELAELFVYTSNQQLKTQNSDATLAFHPIVSGVRLRPVNSKLFWYTTVTYSAAHNLREDWSNTLITGAKLTEFTFSVDNSGIASLKIVVYNNNVIVVNRVIDEQP